MASGGSTRPSELAPWEILDEESGEILQRVHLTSVAACQASAWAILRWAKDGPETGEAPRRAKFFCHSWRCPGCRWWVGRSDFHRIRQGIESRPRWLYLVLTFDRKRWGRFWDAYSALSTLWRNGVYTPLRRRYGSIEYVWTLEQHRSGWPHFNVVLRSKSGELERHFDELGPSPTAKPRRSKRGELVPMSLWEETVLRPMAVEAGFGWVTWAEDVSSPGAMASYMTKLASELTGADGKDQLPLAAPKGTRRYQSSRGLLPPRVRSDPDWTGMLVPHSGQEAGAASWGEVERWIAAAVAGEVDLHREDARQAFENAVRASRGVA